MLFSSIILFALFFSGAENPIVNDSIRATYQQKDSLQLYINKLYELTDDSPFYFSNKADSVLKTLWRKPATINEQTAYLDFILNIAYHLLQQGQIPASIRWYESGLTYYQQNQLNNYEAEEFILKPLGNNYVRLGDYDKAVAIQQMAIQQASKSNKKELLSALYSNLAISYFWLTDYAAVQLNCNLGLQFTSFNQTVTGLLYNVKADAFDAAGIRDSSLIYNQRALRFFQSPEAVEADAGWIVSTLRLSSKLLSDEKKYQPALTKLQNAEKILQQSYPYTRQRDKGKLLVEKGNLFLLLNEIDSSAAAFRKGLQSFQISKNGFSPDNTVSSLYYGLAKSMKLIADSSLYYYQLAVANDYYSNQLISTSANSLQNSIAVDETMNDEAVIAFHELFQRTKNKAYLQKQLWLMELSKGRKLLNEVSRSKQWQTDSSLQQTQQLFRELRYDYLLLAETMAPVRKQQIEQRIRQQELALGLEENRFARLLKEPLFELFVQKLTAVTDSASFLSYYDAGDSLYCIMINKGELQSAVLSSTKLHASLIDFNNRYFKEVSTEFNNNPAAFFTAAQELMQTVIPFKLSVFQLILSPDGLLHQLPFEALSIGNNQFLGEQQQINYVYSFLQYEDEEIITKDALPVTVYSFKGPHLGFAALPNAVTEATYLSKQFSTTVADAVQTTEQEFVQSMQSKAILHIATHAVANDSSNQPYLVLQKKFYLAQLQYTVTAAPLVVLTACETAAGQLQSGEGIVSLGRAFISKGVKGVVASRWKVDDAVAPVFVKTFYEQLNKLHSPAAALMQARKEYLRSTKNLSQKNPLLWAGFNYIGVEQQIVLKKTASFIWYWLLLLLLPLGVYFLRKFKP